jgi:hypothetical protein
MRWRGRHALAPVSLSGPRVVIVRQALADAAAWRRARAAQWCPQCEIAPDGACPEHVEDLAAADAYDGVARELPHGGQPSGPDGSPGPRS